MFLKVRYVRLSDDEKCEYRFIVSIHSKNGLSKTADLILKPNPIKTIPYYDNKSLYEFVLPADDLYKNENDEIIAIITILGSVNNDYNRRCWRNCGTCVVQLSSINHNISKILHNTSSNISETERLSGIINCVLVESDQTLNICRFNNLELFKNEEENVYKSYIDYYKNKKSKDIIPALHEYEVNGKIVYDNIQTNCRILKRLNTLWAPLDYYCSKNVTKSHNMAKLQRISETEFNHNVLHDTDMPKNESELLKLISTCRREGLKTVKDTMLYKLPFYSALYRKSPNISCGYWLNALNIVESRFFRRGIDVFCKEFTNTFDVGRQAAYAAAVINLYAQSIEYISDYIPSRKDPKRRKEVEQFSTALLNMSADCEDLSVAIYQCYNAFVGEDDSISSIPDNDTSDTTIGILSRMKHVLKTYYIPMMFADLINIGDLGDTFETSVENFKCARNSSMYYQMLEEISETNTVGEHPKTKNYTRKDDDEPPSINHPSIVDGFLNCAASAHISIKLIPKSWFVKSTKRYNTHSKILKSKLFDTGIENDNLPVLFMEGTSELFPSDEEPRSDMIPLSSGHYRSLSSYLLYNDYLDDVCKSSNIADKGYSTFYKGSAFACTTKLQDVGSHLFAICRKDNETLWEGVSHDQISHKSKEVYFIHYDELSNPSTPKYESCILDMCQMQRSLDHVKTIIPSMNDIKKSTLEKYSCVADDSLFRPLIEENIKVWKNELNAILDPQGIIQTYKKTQNIDKLWITSKITFDPYYFNPKTIYQLTERILSLKYDIIFNTTKPGEKNKTVYDWFKSLKLSKKRGLFGDNISKDILFATHPKYVDILNAEGIFMDANMDRIASDLYLCRFDVYIKFRQ